MGSEASGEPTRPETAATEWGPKVKKAAQLLLAQRGLSPGAKGWELKKALGRDYKAVLDALNVELEALGLHIKSVASGDSSNPDEARYYAVFKDPPPAGVSLGMRIDDIAMLAASLAYLKARGGRCGRMELEAMLREKFPRWKILMGLRRFERMGYLAEEQGPYSFGWRTMVEVNLASLSALIAALPTGAQGTGQA
jgi:hypothetical protein